MEIDEMTDDITQMEIELNKKLVEKMPYLAPRDTEGKVPEDYDYSYLLGDYELPKGWRELFWQMCVDIREPLMRVGELDEFRFLQVKEKYGTMRCYCTMAPKEVLDIITHYEYLSQFVCEDCGRPAEYLTKGWIGSYCGDCVFKNKVVDTSNLDHIDLDLTYECWRYDKGVKTTEAYDCTDMWNRLYNKE